jgi:hypothetical protein
MEVVVEERATIARSHDNGDGYGMSMSIMRLMNTTKDTIKNYIVKKINASPIHRIRSLIKELIVHMKHYLNG